MLPLDLAFAASGVQRFPPVGEAEQIPVTFVAADFIGRATIQFGMISVAFFRLARGEPYAGSVLDLPGNTSEKP